MENKANRLSKAQWLQWGGATGISTIVMVLTVFTWVEARVYTRVEGEHLEHEIARVEKHVGRFEDRVDKRLVSLHEKVNKIYEILIDKHHE